MSESTTPSHNAPSLRRILGFSCYQGFIYAVFYMGANKALVLGGVAIERADLLATLLGMVIAFCAMTALPRLAGKILASDAAIATCAGMLTAGAFAPRLSGSLDIAGVGLEAFLVGLPMAVLLVAWGRVLGMSSPRVAAWEIFASTGIAAAVCFVASFFGGGASVVLAVALPAASAGVLLVAGVGSAACSHDLEYSERAALSADRDGSGVAALSRRMLVGALMFGLAAGLMETFRSNPGASSTPTLPATLLILSLFCVAAFQSLRGAAEEERSLGTTYRIAILVMMAGFLFTPALYESGVPGEAIVLAGCLGLTAAFIALFIAVSVLRGIDSAMAFCRGFGALYLGEAAGIAAGNVIDGFGTNAAVQHGMLAFAGLAALIAYLFLFTENDFRTLSAIVDAGSAEDAMHDAIVEQAGLSKREAEVLALALRGRTNERIAQELVVAKSTVDTHLRRIYSKAGVHSRQELIDYGEKLIKNATRKR